MAAKPTEWRQRAEELGLRWEDVQAEYRDIRRFEYDCRSYGWHLRYLVGQAYGVPNLGILKGRYRRAFEGGDRDMLPRFDEVADGLALQFPDLARDGDPAEALWNIIAANWDDMPPADESWSEAIDRCLDRAAYESESAVEFDVAAFAEF